MLLEVLDRVRQMEVEAVFINKFMGTEWLQWEAKMWVGVGKCQVRSFMNGSNVGRKLLRCYVYDRCCQQHGTTGLSYSRKHIIYCFRWCCIFHILKLSVYVCVLSVRVYMRA